MRRDRPQSFGYKMGWLAVRATDPSAVASATGLPGFVPGNWNQGIGNAYRSKAVFVSPPIGEWVFVVGGWTYDGEVEATEKRVSALSKTFPEVQLLASHRILDIYAWMRALDGKLERSYFYDGSKTRRDKGTREAPEPPKSKATPDESDVIAIAKAWSLDPTSLIGEPSSGFVAPAPDAAAMAAIEAAEGPTRIVEGGVASSMWEADLSLDGIKICEDCTPDVIQWSKREALPWEAFAYEATAATCKCGRRLGVRFQAGPGWDTQPDNTHAALTNLPGGTRLVQPSVLEKALAASIHNFGTAGDDEDVARHYAREALALMHELSKIDPTRRSHPDHGRMAALFTKKKKVKKPKIART